MLSAEQRPTTVPNPGLGIRPTSILRYINTETEGRA